jgi:hypothetical protein
LPATEEEPLPLPEDAELLDEAPLDELFLEALPFDEEEPPLEELFPFEDDEPLLDADDPPPRLDADLEVLRAADDFDGAPFLKAPLDEAFFVAPPLLLFDAALPRFDALLRDEDFDVEPLLDELFLLAPFLDAAFEKAPRPADLEVPFFDAPLLALEEEPFDDAPFLEVLFLEAVLLLVPRLAPFELDDLEAPFLEAPRPADDFDEAPFLEALFLEALLEELPLEDLLAPFFEAAFFVDFAMLMGLSES